MTSDPAIPPSDPTGFRPCRVVAVELSTAEVQYPDPDFRPGHAAARVLVRWLEEPIGMLDAEVPDDHLPELVASRACQLFAAQLAAAAERHGLPAPSAPADLRLAPDVVDRLTRDLPAGARPVVTVAIASFRNVDPTIECVRRVLHSTWPALEVVVVDNDADGTALRGAMAAAFDGDDRVRWVHEPRQGLSFARNAGLAAARGEIVIFTDDDVLVDRQWVTRLVGAFDAAADVACVTGAILPAELETQAQAWLEEYGGFHKGFDRQVFDTTTHRRDTPLYPYDSGQFGSGANMAFRAGTLREMGGFSVDLGAGTLAHGGEDLDILRRTLSAGHTVVYEPAALMWHHHRRSMEALRRQMYRYGVGLSATVAKWLLDDRQVAKDVLTRIPAGVRHVAAPGSRKNQGKSTQFPRTLTALELVGICVGPVAYLRSRHRTRRVADTAGHAG
jgi:O-antigen biosynthesis protein